MTSMRVRLCNRYRGDIALSVLAEDGRSGQIVAAPIAKRFFDAYG